MAFAERVVPHWWEARRWDGRRLLRFVTGLALIALAFAVQIGAAGPTAEPESGMSLASVEAAAPAEAAPAEAGSADAGSSVVDVTERVGAETPVDAPAAPAAVAGELGLAGLDRGAEASGAIEGAQALTGSTPAVHGSRAPPRR